MQAHNIEILEASRARCERSIARGSVRGLNIYALCHVMLTEFDASYILAVRSTNEVIKFLKQLYKYYDETI